MARVNNPPGGPAPLAGAVEKCRRRAGFLAALGELYEAVDAEVARQTPTCLGGGACCKFDLAGHRLMLSTGELALLSEAGCGDVRRCERLRCPYQIGPRCSARMIRPLGCRVFFCDSALQDWCGDTYEKFHRRIRALHERFAVPYAYVELTAGLREIFDTDSNNSLQ